MTNSGQSHIIYRQVFELDYFSKEDANHLQNRISHLFNEKIAFALSQMFDRITNSTQNLSVDTLSVDLETLPQDWNDEDLVDSIVAAVELELIRKLANQVSINSHADDASVGSHLGNRHLRHIEYFLMNGDRPWWHTGNKTNNWEDIITNLAITHKTDLSHLLWRIGKVSHVRQRMAYQLTKKSIRIILAIIEPDNVHFISDLHQDLSNTQKRKQLVTNDTESFERALWTFILNYLFLENQSFFSRLSFLESTLKSLALHFNLSFSIVLSLFTSAKTLKKRELVKDLPELMLLLSIKHYQSGFHFLNRSSIGLNSVEKNINKEYDLACEVNKYFDLIAAGEATKAVSKNAANPDSSNQPSGDVINKKSRNGIVVSELMELEREIKSIPSERNVTGLIQKNDDAQEVNIQKLSAEHTHTHQALSMLTSRYNELLSALNPSDQQAWAIVGYFLQYGSLPSWIVNIDKTYFLLNLLKIMSAEEELFYKFVQKITSNNQSIIRMVEVMPIEDLHFLLAKCYNGETFPDEKFFTNLIKIAAVNQLSASDAKKVIFADLLSSGLKNIKENPQFHFPSYLKYISHEIQVPQVILHNLLFPNLSQAPQHINQKAKFLSKFSLPVPNGIEPPIKCTTFLQDQKNEILDLLNHYLRYGTWPWWYEGEQKDIQKHLTDMVKQNPEWMAKLIKYAADNEAMKFRLITGIAPEFMVEVFTSLFSPPPKGLEIYGCLIEKLQAIASFTNLEFLAVKQNLIGIYWQILAKGHYQSFDEVQFLADSLRYIAVTLGEKTTTVTKWLTNSSAETTALAVHSIIKSLVIDPDPFDFNTASHMAFYENVHGADLKWIAQDNIWLKPLFRGMESEEEVVIGFYNHLLGDGDTSRIYGLEAVDSRELLNELLAQISERKKEVYSIASPNQETEKYAASLSELEALFHAKQKNFSLNASKKELATLHGFIKATDGFNISTVIQKPDQLALMAISYFLKNGKLPTHYKFSNLVQEQALLKQLIKRVMNWDEVALHSLFNHAEYQILSVEKLATMPYLLPDDSQLSALISKYLDLHLSQALIDLGFGNKLAGGMHIDKFLKDPSTRQQHRLNLLSHLQVRMAFAKNNSIEDLINYAAKYHGSWSQSSSLSPILESYQWMSAQMNDTIERSHMQRLFKAFFILQFITCATGINLDNFLHALLKFISSERSIIFQQLVQSGLLNSVADTESEGGVPKILIISIRRVAEDILQAEQIKSEFCSFEMDKFASFTADPIFSVKENISIPDQSFEPDFELSAESFSIHNSGLVLLHPYIKPFFTNLGLMKDNAFISVKAQFHAIHALQYLIDGKSEHPEEMLILNKILCGLPIKAPVPLQVRFTSDQKKHCEDFISAVIGMWEQMKNSSHANFRGSFLKRDGLLKNDRGDWILRVEPAGYDILLQTIPWGYGVIKNSMMDTTLYVEWQA